MSAIQNAEMKSPVGHYSQVQTLAGASVQMTVHDNKSQSWRCLGHL